MSRRPPAWRPLALCGLMLCLWLAGVLPAAAAPAIVDLAVLADPDGRETIDSVADPARAGDFRPAPHGFSAGYTRQVHWLRFTLIPPAPNPEGLRPVLLEINPPYLDSLQLYWPNADSGGYNVRHSGDLQPYASRELRHRAFVHRLTLRDDRPLTLYLRLQTSSSSVVALDAWEPERFLEASGHEYAWLGLFFGLLLACLLGNLWSGLWKTQPLYRAYLLHLSATLFMLLGSNGLPGEFAFLPDPLWSHHWTSIGMLLVFASGTHFYRLALDLDQAPRWMERLYRSVTLLALLALPAPFLDLYAEAMNLLMPLALVLLGIGLRRSLQLWREQRPSAYPLLAAHLLAILGTLSAMLTMLGVLPGQLWLIHGYQLGRAGTLLAMQWLLSQRIRQIEQDQIGACIAAERAQARADHERAEREQQRRFLAMLTHELKTPLAVLRMHLGTPSPSPAMQRHAEQAIDEINALVERCALTSRIEDRQLLRSPEPCRLDTLLGELRERQPQPERIELDLQPTPGLLSEPLLLRTLLNNLIDNGLKYAPADTRLHLSLAPRREDGQAGLLLRCRNRLGAAGAPDPERLFDKYYRAPGAHAYAGSGLGLYIVRELSALLGGRVRYLPTPSEACFELWLPVTPPS